MLKTNENRKPKSFIVKASVNDKIVYAMRSFFEKGTSADIAKPNFERETGLSKEEALSILAEKQRKNAEVFSLVSGATGKNNYRVSIYILEKAAIRSIKRHSGKYSDDVEIEPNYYFKDEVVENKKAKMYVLKKKVIVIQHTDEIAIFERNNKDAIFVAEVEVKSSTKSTVTVNIEADYHSSADHAKKLDEAKESGFIHIEEKESGSRKSSSVVKIFSSRTKKYKDKNVKIVENLDHLEDGIYKAKDSGIEKRLVIQTGSFDKERIFYLVETDAETVKGKEALDFA